ncbi:MAG: 50S ribosomal protein L6, partial [Patescibacteria group bacterium]
MSRIGKQPIIIPKEVAVKVENGKISVKGPKGELSYKTRPEIKAEIKDGSVVIHPVSDTKKTS